ncbi:GTP-binding protein REM 1 [Platysternon megacephalum]|uniref:GTP-binding protein REM 1 n=1 Tax=Platysternon megacephalum TaxID=55544 RepID=A0A4D9E5E7_9SAUR|nr:GTP-binding protein REM 1 [Platysternon megacephalum]
MKLYEDFPVTVVFKPPVFKSFLTRRYQKELHKHLELIQKCCRVCVCVREREREREGAILKVSVSFAFNGHLLPSCQARTKCAHTNKTGVCFKMPLLCHLKPRLPSHRDPVLKCSRLA